MTNDQRQMPNDQEPMTNAKGRQNDGSAAICTATHLFGNAAIHPAISASQQPVDVSATAWRQGGCGQNGNFKTKKLQGSPPANEPMETAVISPGTLGAERSAGVSRLAPDGV